MVAGATGWAGVPIRAMRAAKTAGNDRAPTRTGHLPRRGDRCGHTSSATKVSMICFRQKHSYFCNALLR